MTPDSLDAHVLLDLHPDHPSAVTAVVTGPQVGVAVTVLEAAGWDVVAKDTLVLARIDHEEPYWANDTARELTAEGASVEITPRLQAAIDEEWTWANYPTPWSTRSEIREVSDAAQKIYSDIRHGDLLIHAHATDNGITVAVGTYFTADHKSVHLHGENHLRQVTDTYDSPAAAMTAFEQRHGTSMLPGPAPMTDTERAAAEARTPPAAHEPPHPQLDTVPAYAGDAGDHDALLTRFLDTHNDWEKWRTWSDDTTHAIHESQILRIELVHEAQARETAWTVAAYESPVSDRTWVLTATGATPAPILQHLLDHLADAEDVEAETDARVSEGGIAAATIPLASAGWNRTVSGRQIRWIPRAGDAAVQYDGDAARHPNQDLAAWTVQAGRHLGRPTWNLTASARAPRSLIAHLADILTREVGTRQPHTSNRTPPSAPGTTLPAGPIRRTR
ncbi:DUF317 domain-containing protein [Actinacidiphila sp. bgisy144]|uniref:DUF317 domain-containing protein n=1 Tax=Actinacidiphila sp. bgisy144 TaxID=3413791 RepID=UPI003EC0EFF4